VREIGATESIAQRPRRGMGLVGQNSIGAAWTFVREIRCNRKASHRGHRRGFGVGGQNSIGASWAFVREIRCNRKHRTEVTEGGIGVGSQKFYRRQRGRPGEKSSLRGRHRTEVAKGDLVRWSKILSATAWASGRELIERNGQSIVESCSGTRSMRKCKSPHRKKRQLGA
jgi:hypothetical protein